VGKEGETPLCGERRIIAFSPVKTRFISRRVQP
jgi:hypothetical protein